MWAVLGHSVVLAEGTGLTSGVTHRRLGPKPEGERSVEGERYEKYAFAALVRSEAFGRHAAET